jgi:hypothetical protein
MMYCVAPGLSSPARYPIPLSPIYSLSMHALASLGKLLVIFGVVYLPTDRESGCDLSIYAVLCG